MRTTVKPLFFALAAYGAAFALSLPSGSDAAHARVHSSACTWGTALYSHAEAVNGAYSNNKNGDAKSLYCPAVSTSALPHHTAKLNVHGYEASGRSNSSMACVKRFNNTGFACGARGYWGSGSAGASNVSTAYWINEPASMPYIRHDLDGYGRFYGYFMYN